MILSIWALLLAFSLILVIAGRYTDAPPLQIGGYTILFILGVVLMLGGLQYQTGELTLTNYTYNVCEEQEVNCCNCSISSTLENKTLVYNNFNDEYVHIQLAHHTVGFLICVLSVFGFMSVFFNLDKNPFKKKRNKEVYDYGEE